MAFSSLRFSLTLVALAVLFGSGSRADGVTYSVPGDFPTIQAAIDASSTGDEIEVGPGTYVENVDFLNKSIALRSTMGPDVTTIDGSNLTAGAVRGSTVILCDGGAGNPLLEGFTITGGTGFEGLGGGIYCRVSGATIRNCRIVNNVTFDGGGLAAVTIFGDLVIEDCVFASNEATRDGGAIYAYGVGSLTLNRCEVLGQVADLGAGGYIAMQTVAMTDCNFRDNAINPGFAYGAALCLGPVSGATTGFAIDAATLTNCEFTGNSAPFGGAAMLTYQADVTCVQCRFFENVAGTGVVLLSDSAEVAFEYCVLARNEATSEGEVITPGINGSHITLDHCTVVDNQCDGGVFYQGVGPFSSPLDPVVTVTNSIVQSNENPTWLLDAGVDATFAYSNIETFTAAAGPGVIDADALFIDLDGGDYRLAPGSPCIDSGDPLYPLDPDGSLTDMGAYPFVDAPYFVRGDANQDGIVDLADGIHVLGTIILGIYTIDCDDAADANSDQSISVADPIFIFAYQFQDGPAPAAPFPSCGTGSDGLLDCVDGAACAP